jgi:hypothetical protein
MTAPTARSMLRLWGLLPCRASTVDRGHRSVCTEIVSKTKKFTT